MLHTYTRTSWMIDVPRSFSTFLGYFVPDPTNNTVESCIKGSREKQGPTMGLVIPSFYPPRQLPVRPSHED